MSTKTLQPATPRSRPVAIAASVLGLVALAVLAPTAPATAAPVAPAQIPTATPGVTAPAPDPTIASISPDLALVAVDGPQYRTVKAGFDATAKDLADTVAARVGAEAQISQLTAQDRELTQQLARDTVARKDATARLTTVRAALRAIAVTSYVEGPPQVQLIIDLDKANAAEARAVTFDALTDREHANEATAAALLEGADKALNADLNTRTQARLQLQAVQSAHDESAQREAALTAQLAQQQIDLDQARAHAEVQYGDGMSLLALDAYWKAAQAIATSKPKCGITWWALAGIGRVEGHHGTFGGAQVQGNGDTSKPIVGITLDGTNDTAVIGDTDGGEYDGDPSFDHAVGPMQFIPSTWARWKGDGNGDGKADPNNMYDATLGAANYLCASGPMQSDEDLTRGYLSYNHSDEYAAIVLSDAQYYRDTVRIPTPPPAGVVPAAATTPVRSGG